MASTRKEPCSELRSYAPTSGEGVKITTARSLRLEERLRGKPQMTGIGWLRSSVTAHLVDRFDPKRSFSFQQAASITPSFRRSAIGWPGYPSIGLLGVNPANTLSTHFEALLSVWCRFRCSNRSEFGQGLLCRIFIDVVQNVS